MITIIYETHSTSLDNEQGLASGYYDVGLSELGEKQARELGDRHRKDPPDAVYCSDLRRAVRTAEIAFAERGIPIIEDARLRELDYGDWTRRPSQEVDAERARHITEPFPNGESYADAMARMGSFLADLLQSNAGQRVVVIGHIATHYGLEHWINGRPLEDLIRGRFVWQPGWKYLLEVGVKDV
jgi:2,3-bisphosphoglycerate-dependent phosphoglycerate mutase